MTRRTLYQLKSILPVLGLVKISSLYALKELSLKEELLAKMEKDLELFKRKFSVILHQKVITASNFYSILFLYSLCGLEVPVSFSFINTKSMSLMCSFNLGRARDKMNCLKTENLMLQGAFVR